MTTGTKGKEKRRLFRLEGNGPDNMVEKRRLLLVARGGWDKGGGKEGLDTKATKKKDQPWWGKSPWGLWFLARKD